MKDHPNTLAAVQDVIRTAADESLSVGELASILVSVAHQVVRQSVGTPAANAFVHRAAVLTAEIEDRLGKSSVH